MAPRERADVADREQNESFNDLRRRADRQRNRSRERAVPDPQHGLTLKTTWTVSPRPPPLATVTRPPFASARPRTRWRRPVARPRLLKKRSNPRASSVGVTSRPGHATVIRTPPTASAERTMASPSGAAE